MNTNIERIKKINSIKEVSGTNHWRDEYKPLFLVRNNMGKQGVVDESGTTVVDVEYDSIFPIGYGIWICSKAGKFGAFAFDVTQDGTLYIKGWIDCKYDYFKAIAGGPAVSLYTYDFESYDRKDTFIGSTGELIKHSDCEWVKYLDTTSKYCLVSNKGKTYIYDTKSGERFYIKDIYICHLYQALLMMIDVLCILSIKKQGNLKKLRFLMEYPLWFSSMSLRRASHI